MHHGDPVKRLERELSKFKVLYELALNMTSEKTLEENLAYIVEQSRLLLSADTSYIALADEQKKVVAMHTLSGVRTEAFKKMVLPYGKGLGGKVMSTRRGYIVRDYMTNGGIQHVVDPIVLEEGVVSGMAVPIQTGSHSYGVLYVFNRNITEFTEEDLDTLLLLGNLAAVEISRKRMESALRTAHDELEQRVLDRTGELQHANEELRREMIERSRAEEARRESEEKYRLLVENMSEIAFIISLDMYTFYVSPSIERVLGFTPEERSLQSPQEQLTPESLRLAATTLSAELARESLEGADPMRAVTLELDYYHKDGSLRCLETTFSAMRGSTGRIEAIYGLARDITDRKRSQEERLAMERQLLHAQKLESLGVLAGGIAHDFNNLLTAIIGNLDLSLQDISEFSPARTTITQALQASRRAADLTRQMLAYSGKGRFEFRDIDLGELLRENVHLFGASISKSASLSLDVSPGLPLFRADPGQVQQIVMNLITNASEAIDGQAGAIVLSAGVCDCTGEYLAKSRVEDKPEPGPFVFIEVADTGCGMDEETSQRLFDPFFTTKFTGRGLGMSAVLGIVRAHKGAIIVNSGTTGTTIRVLFPVSARESSQPAEQGTNQAPGQRSSFSGTVLVVDDEKAVRRLCRAQLERIGFDVIEAGDGAEALRIFREKADAVRLVLLDLTMPQMDGLQTFREMKVIRADVKVVLFSGYSEEDALQRFRGEGLAGFLPKPFQMKDLQDIVARALS